MPVAKFLVPDCQDKIDSGIGLSFPQSTYISRDEQVQCICPLSWSVHCNFTGEGKCNERGWACTPHPHQPGLILPSSLNVRQKAAVATLCTLRSYQPARLQRLAWRYDNPMPESTILNPPFSDNEFYCWFHEYLITLPYQTSLSRLKTFCWINCKRRWFWTRNYISGTAWILEGL